MAYEIKVSDVHRINALSLTPGGASLTLVHSNGKNVTYDKIKNISAYLEKAVTRDDSIIQAKVNGEVIWRKS